MANRQDPSHQANPVSANTYHPALHLLGAQGPRVAFITVHTHRSRLIMFIVL
jgi:hypothetical protein